MKPLHQRQQKHKSARADDSTCQTEIADQWIFIMKNMESCTCLTACLLTAEESSSPSLQRGIRTKMQRVNLPRIVLKGTKY